MDSSPLLPEIGTLGEIKQSGLFWKIMEWEPCSEPGRTLMKSRETHVPRNDPSEKSSVETGSVVLCGQVCMQRPGVQVDNELLNDELLQKILFAGRPLAILYPQVPPTVVEIGFSAAPFIMSGKLPDFRILHNSLMLRLLNTTFVILIDPLRISFPIHETSQTELILYFSFLLTIR